MKKPSRTYRLEVARPPRAVGRMHVLLGATLLLLWGGCRDTPIEPIFTGRLTGQVVSAETLEPIAKALVSTNPPTQTVFTDSLGQFDLGAIPVASYSVQAEKAGYVTSFASAELIRDQTLHVVVRLPRDTADNAAPSAPAQPRPFDGATDQPIELQLCWQAADPDGDALQFDLWLFPGPDGLMTRMAHALEDTCFTLSGLQYGTDYIWQVSVSDGRHDPLYGPVWHFRTRAFPSLPVLAARPEGVSMRLVGYDNESLVMSFDLPMPSAWRPRYSPQRDKVAFIGLEGAEPVLMIMNPDGTEVAQLSILSVNTLLQREAAFSWSPDGARLLFPHFAQMFLVNRDGSGLQLFAEAPPGQMFAACDWSPSGDRIAVRTVGNYPYTSRLYLYDIQGSILQLLVDDLPGSTGNPAFSPDGKKLVYTHDISGFEATDGRQLDARIFLMNLDNQSITDLSFDKPAGYNELDPRFSPDGAWIVFTQVPNDGSAPPTVWKMDLQGENRTLLFENAAMPDWR